MQKTKKRQAYSDKAEAFYSQVLKILKESKIPFVVSGTLALKAHAGIVRPTKDLDIFCMAHDYPKILDLFRKKGYTVEIRDERWLAKIKKDGVFLDVIFASHNGGFQITESWFKEGPTAGFFGSEVKVIPATEFVASKMFVQNRHKYDGNDCAHIILKKHEDINWDKLLAYTNRYWEVLLITLLNFRFIYPSERDAVPDKLLDELLKRLETQRSLPAPEVKICRGRVYSLEDFWVDVSEWGFGDLVGNPNEISEQTTEESGKVRFKKEVEKNTYTKKSKVKNKTRRS